MSDSVNKSEDDDHLFLDQILNKLYDFGDKPTAKKKRKRKRQEEEELTAEEDVCSDTNSCTAELVGGVQEDRQEKDLQKGPSVSQKPQVEVVVFHDPTKRPRMQQNPAQSEKKAPPTSAPDNQKLPETKDKRKTKEPEEFSLEKARLEVHRFGITGYKKEQQRVFEQERAIMLGAQPPKKEYINYKLLQEQVKQKKDQAKLEDKDQPELTKKAKKANKARDERRKQSADSGSAPSGQVGRFKNGLLVLSTKEIQKIKGSRGRR